jgi:hypothetical protein
MICIDLDNMTLEQSIVNLFEMKETIGKPHAQIVATQIIIKCINDTVDGKAPGQKYRDMIDKIVDYVLDNKGEECSGLIGGSSSCV